jgi:hypothetical protein
MSIVQSISIDSSSSTGTMATIPLTDDFIDASNDLYENRDHFQAIFSNDSRFFDTSLHLFKSYSTLGYVHVDKDMKHNLHIESSLTTSSNGHKHRWRKRLLGLNTNENSNGTLRAFLTPTLLRKQSKHYMSDIFELVDRHVCIQLYF